MHHPPDRDSILDGLALVQAAHEHDGEAAVCILDHGDTASITLFLAAVCRDLLRDLAAVCDEPSGDLLGELRRRVCHANGL
jgi:hypothetical protein